MKRSYNTLSGAIDGLRKEGYTLDFNIQEEYIAYHAKNTLLSPDDFEIDIIYRFEGMTDPDDQCILYAISSEKFELKGILVNGYGISADVDTNEVVSRLHMPTV